MYQTTNYKQLFIFITMVLSIVGCETESSVTKDSVSKKTLNAHWQFKKQTDTTWHKASVPGTVHTDLIALGQIEDPYYRLNEHNLQWIDKEDWGYKTTFSLTDKDLSKEHIALEFLGLDTYSKVYLNDSLLLETDNMFRTYTADVKTVLKIGENTLKIEFESPINKGIKKYNALGYTLPVSDNDMANIGKVEGDKQVSIFTRKAGYHFGWDWGPRLVTSGIWRPITLRSWNSHRIENLFIKQHSINEKASLSATIELIADQETKTADVEITVDGNLIKTAAVNVVKGENTIAVPFDIENPKLWWPNGMGDQVLYDVAVKVTANSYTDTASHKIGLRTVELVQEPDSIGSSFYFKVNGHPVFMKGANYIPQDVFLTRTTPSNYKHILNSAKTANMNMIRVWGGGIYETEEFYELCDEMGLLVWQDFMFACAMFPGDKDFLENVKQEAIDNVKRLRNHTSIALWCGNNEILSAWENWGWKDKVTAKQSKNVADTIWKAYDDLFHKVLPEVVKAHDSSRAYWPSSPGSEFGKKESFEKGDAHYWNVWWGKQPFENYNTAVPRFMSEYGFQSFPEFSSVKKYTLEEDYDVYSEVMKSHQRSSIGNKTIEDYMLRHYHKPKDFESFLYVSQLLQAYGIQIGIESHRRNRARCMGSLYWQINDCWPVASWSSIDYYGKWKALHYTVKRSFENLLITHEKHETGIDVYVVSDSLKNMNATLKVRLMDFDGNALNEWKEDILVDGNHSKKQMTLLQTAFPNDSELKNSFLHAELSSKGQVVTENIIYLLPFKKLELPDPELSYSVKEQGDLFEVVLRTKKLAKSVFLSGDFDINFSDNYFDMLPNTEKTVTIKKEASESLKAFKDKLKVITLINTY